MDLIVTLVLALVVGTGLFYASTVTSFGRADSQARATSNDPRLQAQSTAQYTSAVDDRAASPNMLRQLAQLYLRDQQPQKAISLLERVYRLQPDSYLVVNDLAGAYEASGDMQQAEELWATIEVDADKMVALGDVALDQGLYDQAAVWYTRVSKLRPERSDELAFRRAVLATLNGSAETERLVQAAQAADPGLMIFSASEVEQVAGRNLRWFMCSAPGIDPGVLVGASYESPEAYLWWSGEVVAFVRVTQAGVYRLRVETRHSMPPPVELTFGIDEQDMKSFTLARGDNSWETIAAQTRLDPGLHIIRLRFTNNAIVNGEDRDAAIAWFALDFVS